MDSQVGRIVHPNWSKIKETLTSDRLVGVELEYENVRGVNLGEPHTVNNAHSNFVTPRWQAVRDGSLRDNGAEFVSSPLLSSRVPDALLELFVNYKERMPRWRVSVRTGLHVHVDVRDFTNENLKTLQTLYCLIEPALFNYVGIEREENVFCIPWYRAPQDCHTITKTLGRQKRNQDIVHIAHLREPHISKYDALNWSPVPRLGTVEFRHALNALEMNVIAEWIEICSSVVCKAKTSSQSDILSIYLQNIDEFPVWVHRKLRTPNYESRMLLSGAECLANSTIKSESTFNPANASEWVRVNDSLPAPKKSSRYGHELTFSESLVQQIHAAAGPMHSIDELNQDEWPPNADYEE